MDMLKGKITQVQDEGTIVTVMVKPDNLDFDIPVYFDYRCFSNLCNDNNIEQARQLINRKVEVSNDNYNKFINLIN